MQDAKEETKRRTEMTWDCMYICIGPHPRARMGMFYRILGNNDIYLSWAAGPLAASFTHPRAAPEPSRDLQERRLSGPGSVV